jgi:inorganic triphosphatase YgiF
MAAQRCLLEVAWDADMTTAARAPHESSCEAEFTAIVLGCADAIDVALAVCMTSDDPAGPHKTRVALRRLTTALDAFRPILRRKAVAGLRHTAKGIFRDLGRVRDSDVLLGDAGRRDRPKAQVAKNVALREAARTKIAKGRKLTFTRDLRAAVGPDGNLFRRSGEAVKLREAHVSGFATGVLRASWQRCLGYGASVQAIPEESRHDFRKDMKTLRYLSEFFAGLFPGLQDEPFRSDFRDIQDALGEVNDYEVALNIEGGKRPASPPERVTRALAEAEVLWARLSAAAAPWSAEVTSPD